MLEQVHCESLSRDKNSLVYTAICSDTFKSSFFLSTTNLVFEELYKSVSKGVHKFEK